MISADIDVGTDGFTSCSGVGVRVSCAAIVSRGDRLAPRRVVAPGGISSGRGSRLLPPSFQKWRVALQSLRGASAGAAPVPS